MSNWQMKDSLDELRAVNQHLLAALKTLSADVQQYEAWQRPVMALELAWAAIERAERPVREQRRHEETSVAAYYLSLKHLPFTDAISNWMDAERQLGFIATQPTRDE